MTTRRYFLAAAGAAVAFPCVALAQRALPLVGWLNTNSAASVVASLAAFKRGLADGGFVEGKSVTIEYAWADGQIDRVPGELADLLQKHPAVGAVAVAAAVVGDGGVGAVLTAQDVTTERSRAATLDGRHLPPRG
jgi:putative ABC transport system substrate-binding protein